MKRVPAGRKRVSAPKTAVAKKRRAKKKVSALRGKIIKYSLVLLLAAFTFAIGYHYRHGLMYWLGFKTDKRIDSLTKEERRLEDLRIYEILSDNKDKVFGFDVSHYQGNIAWDSIQRENVEFPMQFVFIRATTGKDGTDNAFAANWKNAGANGFICGAYHYYRPNENSLKQADNFIKHVRLAKGDLPPVLDIERMPRKQSMDSLKTGLNRWIAAVQKHYGVKPILYTSERFYSDFLKNEFSGYTVWIANYSFFEDEIKKEWNFWQFTDKGALKGIPGNVDINIYNGSWEDFKKLLIP